MPGMLSVLGSFNLEPPYCFVFWYLEPDVWSRQWQYLMILELCTCYHTSPDASHIPLWQSVIFQSDLETSLTGGVYGGKKQHLYSLASGNIAVEVPLESGCNYTDKLGWHLHQRVWMVDTQDCVCLGTTVINSGGDVTASLWRLVSVRIHISIIPASGHMIPISMSFFPKIYHSLSSSRQTIPFMFGASISRSW